MIHPFCGIYSLFNQLSYVKSLRGICNIISPLRVTFKNEISHNTLHNELILKAICIEIKIHLRTGSIVNQFKE